MMCTSYEHKDADPQLPVIVVGCSDESCPGRAFGKRPWLAVGNKNYMHKVATFRNDDSRDAFITAFKRFIAAYGVQIQTVEE